MLPDADQVRYSTMRDDIPNVAPSPAEIGVVVVTFNSARVILDCLDSLESQEGPRPKIVVVDNCSSDDTVQIVRSWFLSRGEFVEGLATTGFLEEGQKQDVLIRSLINVGFAAGVNIGLQYLARQKPIRHFWILNPDSIVDPAATSAIVETAHAHHDYGLLCGRICFIEPKSLIQTDGGKINRLTGVTKNLNLGRYEDETTLPDEELIEFVSGANMVASRAFYETVGPMNDDYFLYYEEVDWALRRGDLKIVSAPRFVVRHHAGTAIGSASPHAEASPFSLWFRYRSRMRFMRRFYPKCLPIAIGFALGKSFQLALNGRIPHAIAIMRATLNFGAPQVVRSTLSQEASRLVFRKFIP